MPENNTNKDKSCEEFPDKLIANVQNIKLDSSHYISLWIFFETRGGSDKDRMITIMNWLFGVAIALLGYIGAKVINYKDLLTQDFIRLIIYSVIGSALSLFGVFIVKNFATFAQRNFLRADKIKCSIPDLKNAVSTSLQYPPSHHFDRVGRIFDIYFNISRSLLVMYSLLLICGLLGMSILPVDIR